MLRLIAALLVLACAQPAMSQQVLGQAGGIARHGNIDRPDNQGAGHAIDQQADAAEAATGGACVWSDGIAGLPSYLSCQAGLGDLLGNVSGALALLAGLLAALLLLFWFYLHRAASAARKAANHISTAERAYVFGGPTDLDLLPHRATVKLAMENYGKTPAMLKEWLVDFTGVEPQGNRPVYDATKRVTTSEILEPDRLFSPPMVFRADIPAPFFVVGYIAYADVFDQLHTTRFCVAVAPDGKAVTAGPTAWNGND